MTLRLTAQWRGIRKCSHSVKRFIFKNVLQAKYAEQQHTSGMCRVGQCRLGRLSTFSQALRAHGVLNHPSSTHVDARYCNAYMPQREHNHRTISDHNGGYFLFDNNCIADFSQVSTKNLPSSIPSHLKLDTDAFYPFWYMDCVKFLNGPVAIIAHISAIMAFNVIHNYICHIYAMLQLLYNQHILPPATWNNHGYMLEIAELALLYTIPDLGNGAIHSFKIDNSIHIHEKGE